MSIISRFTCSTKAIAFYSVSQNNRWLALVRRGLSIGCIDLVGIVTTAIQIHNLIVGHIGNQFKQLRVLAEKVLARIGTAIKFVVLQFAVTDFVHALNQQPSRILFDQAIPVTSPNHLDHIPTSTAENTF